MAQLTIDEHTRFHYVNEILNNDDSESSEEEEREPTTNKSKTTQTEKTTTNNHNNSNKPTDQTPHRRCTYERPISEEFLRRVRRFCTIFIIIRLKRNMR